MSNIKDINFNNLMLVHDKLHLKLVFKKVTYILYIYIWHYIRKLVDTWIESNPFRNIFYVFTKDSISLKFKLKYKF